MCLPLHEISTRVSLNNRPVCQEATRCLQVLTQPLLIALQGRTTKCYSPTSQDPYTPWLNMPRCCRLWNKTFVLIYFVIRTSHTESEADSSSNIRHWSCKGGRCDAFTTSNPSLPPVNAPLGLGKVWPKRTEWHLSPFVARRICNHICEH